MAENTNDTGRNFETENKDGKSGQTPTSQQSQANEGGKQPELDQQQGSESSQSSSPETGSESATSQGEFTGQTETSVAERSGEQSGIEGTGGSTGASSTAATGGASSGFVGSQGTDSPDYLKQDEQSSSDQSFAKQGQGAGSETEKNEDRSKTDGAL